jgi:hypothetical protein
VIFAHVVRVMCWYGSMMIMESFGTSASNAIGGISTTINCQNGGCRGRAAKMAEYFSYRTVLTVPILMVYLGKQWTGIATMISKEAI